MSEKIKCVFTTKRNGGFSHCPEKVTFFVSNPDGQGLKTCTDHAYDSLALLAQCRDGEYTFIRINAANW